MNLFKYARITNKRHHARNKFMKNLLLFTLLAFSDPQGGENCLWEFKYPPEAAEIAEIRSFPHYPPNGMAPCKNGWCASNQGQGVIYKTHIYQRKGFDSKFGEDLAITKAFLSPPTYPIPTPPYEVEMFKIGEIVEIRWIGPDGGLFFFNQFGTKLPLFRGRACNALW